jgi:hypothetical protein
MQDGWCGLEFAWGVPRAEVSVNDDDEEDDEDLMMS